MKIRAVGVGGTSVTVQKANRARSEAIERGKPEQPPDVSWLRFEEYGVTGLGRRRTTDIYDNIVVPPRPWLHILFGWCR